MREPIGFQAHVNGVGLQVWEWPGDGPTVFFAHATGFHGRCWDRVIERLPGVHAYAVDMRGHGRSEKPEPPYPWVNFGRDVAALGRHLGLDGALGVGHSKGGHAVTFAASLEPGLFAKLLLVDPVIGPRMTHPPRMGDGDHFAARRRNEWASADEMFERFSGRPPFSNWDPAVLRDYCEYGLLPNPAGEGFVLACPPRIEAATYAGAYTIDIYPAIESLTIPVRVLRARARTEGGPMDMSSSPTAPDLASHFEHGEDVYLPEYSHFIPMEDPGLVARHVLELLG